MSHKRAFEAIDRSLRDICGTQKLMGGTVVLLAGDFTQTLPVIPKGTAANELNTCLKSSYLWSHVIKLNLCKNMRVHIHKDVSAEVFSNELMKIGEGQIEMNTDGKIQLPLSVCRIVNNVEELISSVFPTVSENYLSDDWLCGRSILAPTNNVVTSINTQILKIIPGEEKLYYSLNSVINDEETTSYPMEFLNSLELPGIPSYKLKLKIGVPAILLRNINAPKLCNGTRLRITAPCHNVLNATNLTGCYRGEEVLIPKIPVSPTDLPFQFKRVQFPIKVAFAMSINKSQEQTMEVVGVHLEPPCFSHGQLYIAFSRVSACINLYVFSEIGQTVNKVYKKKL